MQPKSDFFFFPFYSSIIPWVNDTALYLVTRDTVYSRHNFFSFTSLIFVPFYFPTISWMSPLLSNCSAAMLVQVPSWTHLNYHLGILLSSIILVPTPILEPYCNQGDQILWSAFFKYYIDFSIVNFTFYSLPTSLISSCTTSSPPSLYSSHTYLLSANQHQIYIKHLHTVS